MAIRHPNGRWTVERLPNGDWHPEEIKSAVRKRGSTLYDLSRDAGLPEHACRSALRGPNFEGEFAIAEFLSLSPREIWPSRFRSDGGRIPQVRHRTKARPTPSAGHRQNASAS
ncbi:putative transcriptional regulator, Nlp [Xanthobacter versatilis]|uniref:Putative transcriptional regulator, Nlp n=1 Tax=Xanthobacter autotrophicus (strain ATCC BAA-1158 / Py2) TaxID=78245 RepID=A7IP05_XANP2|nr:putative transcriptional regulator, Nlp [Xanthobacter autotrophicus Py2]